MKTIGLTSFGIGYFKKNEQIPYEPIVIQNGFEILKEIHLTLKNISWNSIKDIL